MATFTFVTAEPFWDSVQSGQPYVVVSADNKHRISGVYDGYGCFDGNDIFIFIAYVNGWIEKQLIEPPNDVVNGTIQNADAYHARQDVKDYYRLRSLAFEKIRENLNDPLEWDMSKLKGITVQIWSMPADGIVQSVLYDSTRPCACPPL